MPNIFRFSTAWLRWFGPLALIASLSGDKDEESSAEIQKSLELALGKDNPLNIMLKSLPLEIQQAMHYAISVFQMTQRENVLAILPFMPII